MKVKFELSPFRCISNRTLPFFPLFNPTIIIPRTKISFLRFWRHFIYVKSYFSCWFRKLCKLEVYLHCIYSRDFRKYVQTHCLSKKLLINYHFTKFCLKLIGVWILSTPTICLPIPTMKSLDQSLLKNHDFFLFS